MHTTSNFIGGERADAAATYDLIDPCSAQPNGAAPDSTRADVDRAVAAARAARREWRRTTPGERATMLLGLADAVAGDTAELARLESLNTGKPVAHAAAEIGLVLDHLRFFAGAARTLEGKAAAEYVRDHTSWIRREPVGVIGQIVPWNYPLLMATWKIGAALAAGNTVVLKPAPSTPFTAVRLAELAAPLLPAGAFNVVAGGDRVGATLVEHPDVDMVALTGSRETGRRVGEVAGRLLKRTHLELGGKAPVIVFADADVERAAERIALGGFYNAGQDCTAATRVLVAAQRRDELVERLAAAAKAHVLGAADEDATTLGPVNNARQHERVTGFLDRLPAHANVVAGGSAVARPGYFVEPTVVTGMRQDDEIVRHEVFGPVISVQAFRDEHEALALANDTRYGLASSVWTENLGRALRMSNGLEVGVVWINEHWLNASEMPHGGRGDSGHGNDMSQYAVDEYTVVKHVMASLA